MFRTIIILLGVFVLIGSAIGVFVFLNNQPVADDFSQTPSLGEGSSVADNFLPPPSNNQTRTETDSVDDSSRSLDELPLGYVMGVNGERIETKTFLTEEQITSQNALYSSWDEGEVVWHSYQLNVTETDDLLPYEMHYYPPYAFSIILFERPFDETRQQAETDFLALMGVSQEEACRIDVVVVVPPYLDESLAGRNLGLSFCLNSEPLWDRSR